MCVYISAEESGTTLCVYIQARKSTYLCVYISAPVAEGLFK